MKGFVGLVLLASFVAVRAPNSYAQTSHDSVSAYADRIVRVAESAYRDVPVRGRAQS